MAASLFRWINFGPEIDEIDLQAFGEWQEEGVDPFVIQRLSGSDTGYAGVFDRGSGNWLAHTDNPLSISIAAATSCCRTNK